ncbi:MAG: hypothetical protein PWP08_776 [Methanofollis sp.]|nr:hypothetical protein [Methanofollis sp.]
MRHFMQYARGDSPGLMRVQHSMNSGVYIAWKTTHCNRAFPHPTTPTRDLVSLNISDTGSLFLHAKKRCC